MTENTNKPSFNLPRVAIAYASKNKKVLRIAFLDETGKVDSTKSYFLFLWELNQYFDGLAKMRETGEGKHSIAVYKSTPLPEEPKTTPKTKK